MLDGYIKDFLADPIVQIAALIIGVISGSIGIFQYISSKKEKFVAKEIRKPNSTSTIKYYLKSICADCESTLSKNSNHCIVCGSSNPFNSERHLENIERKLSWTYEVFTRIIGEDSIIDDLKELLRSSLLAAAIIFLMMHLIKVFFSSVSVTLPIFSLLVLLWLIYIYNISMSSKTNSLSYLYASHSSRKKISEDAKTSNVYIEYAINSFESDLDAISTLKGKIEYYISLPDRLKREVKSNRLIIWGFRVIIMTTLSMSFVLIHVQYESIKVSSLSLLSIAMLLISLYVFYKQLRFSLKAIFMIDDYVNYSNMYYPKAWFDSNVYKIDRILGEAKLKNDAVSTQGW